MKQRLLSLTTQFKCELKAYQMVLKDPRTPWLPRALLAGAIAYTLSPIDIIPDFIPILGHLDDVVVVPLLVFLGVRLTPRQVMEDCRKKVTRTQGSERGQV